MFEYRDRMPSYVAAHFQGKRKKDRRKKYLHRWIVTGRERIYCRLFHVWSFSRLKDATI